MRHRLNLCRMKHSRDPSYFLHHKSALLYCHSKVISVCKIIVTVHDIAPILMKNLDGSSIKTSRTNVNRKFSQIPHFFVLRHMADAQDAAKKCAGAADAAPAGKLLYRGYMKKRVKR